MKEEGIDMMNSKKMNTEKEIGSSNKLIPCYLERIERTKKMNMNQSFLINKKRLQPTTLIHKES